MILYCAQFPIGEEPRNSIKRYFHSPVHHLDITSLLSDAVIVLLHNLLQPYTTKSITWEARPAVGCPMDGSCVMGLALQSCQLAIPWLSTSDNDTSHTL